MKLIPIFLLLSFVSQAQFTAHAGPGITKNTFSGELGIGYRINRVSFVAGYVSPSRQDLPTYFNMRVGYQFGPVIPYIGYVRACGPQKDRNLIDLGARVSLIKYENGNIFLGMGYMGVPYGHLGLSWNLFDNNLGGY